MIEDLIRFFAIVGALAAALVLGYFMAPASEPQVMIAPTAAGANYGPHYTVKDYCPPRSQTIPRWHLWRKSWELLHDKEVETY